MKHIFCSIRFQRAVAPIIHGRVLPRRKISSHRVACSEKRGEQIVIKNECPAMHHQFDRRRPALQLPAALPQLRSHGGGVPATGTRDLCLPLSFALAFAIRRFSKAKPAVPARFRPPPPALTACAARTKETQGPQRTPYLLFRKNPA
jgi:hypothetical protein